MKDAIRHPVVWIVLLAALLLGLHIGARVACDVPLGEPCGTDTECECLFGEDAP
jgi:hypothetical protein